MRFPTLVTGLVLVVLASASCSDSGPEAGATLYASRCAFCHGNGGGGDGPAGKTMDPAPADMTSPAFWQGKTSETLGKTILQGVPGSAMPGYQGTLDPDQLAALITYIESFRPDAAKEKPE